MAMTHCVVRWQDGSHDNNRTCEICGLGPVDHNNSSTCQYPVYKDYYKEIITKKTYWDYLESATCTSYVPSDKRRGTSKDIHEPDLANPDNLTFRKRHTGAEIHDEYSE